MEQLQQKSELCDQLQNVQNINDELTRTKAKQEKQIFMLTEKIDLQTKIIDQMQMKINALQ